jgi:hypothetical protein
MEYENSFPITQRRYVNNGSKWLTAGIRIPCKSKKKFIYARHGLA